MTQDVTLDPRALILPHTQALHVEPKPGSRSHLGSAQKGGCDCATPVQFGGGRGQGNGRGHRGHGHRGYGYSGYGSGYPIGYRGYGSGYPIGYRGYGYGYGYGYPLTTGLLLGSALGAATSYYNYRCGYYPYPPCNPYAHASSGPYYRYAGQNQPQTRQK